MNIAAVTGTVSTMPTHYVLGFVPTTVFAVCVLFVGRQYRLRIRALNELADTARHFQPGDHVSITGYLHTEANPSHTDVAHQLVEIVAYEIDHQPAIPLNSPEMSR